MKCPWLLQMELWPSSSCFYEENKPKLRLKRQEERELEKGKLEIQAYFFLKVPKSLNETFGNKEGKIYYYQGVRILDSSFFHTCAAADCPAERFNKPGLCWKTLRRWEESSHLITTYTSVIWTSELSPMDYFLKPSAIGITWFLFTLRSNTFGREMDKQNWNK